MMEITEFEAFCPLRSSLFLGVIQVVMEVIELGQDHVFGVSDTGPSGSDITEVVFCVCLVSCGRIVVESLVQISQR
jgi:hypothetical protein